MRNKNSLVRMSALLRLRKAITAGDRLELAAKSTALQMAKTHEASAAEVRDDGVLAWQAGLSANTFDPEIVGIAGAWLLDLEQKLAAAQLDTSIAGSRQGIAANQLAHSQAKETAGKKSFSIMRKELEKKLEERQTADQTDMFLGSWSR